MLHGKALYRDLVVRQAAAAGLDLPRLGRARRLPAAAGGCALCAAGLLAGLAIRTRPVGPPGGALGGGTAGFLPGLRYSLGGDAAGRRSADAGAAHRRGLAGVAWPRLLERDAGRDRVSGECQGRLRAGGLRHLERARAAHAAGRICDSQRAGGSLAMEPGCARPHTTSKSGNGGAVTWQRRRLSESGPMVAADRALAGLSCAYRDRRGCGSGGAIPRRIACVGRSGPLSPGSRSPPAGDSFRATISSFCRWPRWPARADSRCWAAAARWPSVRCCWSRWYGSDRVMRCWRAT